MNFFNEHNEVVRPDWLGAKWEDVSWHNDAMPHAMIYLTPGVVYPSPVVEVWVNYAKPEDREVGKLYEVMYLADWGNESGGDERLYIGDDEAVAKQFARGAEIAQTIIADILARPVRTTSRGKKANLLNATSFSELHDYCDANVLGDQEKLLDEFGHTSESEVMDDETRDRRDQDALDKAVDVLNHAQGIVDVWLRSRRPVAETPLPKKQFEALLKSVRTGEVKLSDIEVPPPTRKRKR